jgi:hypothetical protein
VTGSTLRKRIWLLPVAIAVVVTLLQGRAFVRWLDLAFFHEEIRDAIGRLRTDEDWSGAAALPAVLDAAWIEQNDRRPFRIAHALGAPDTAENNTIAAYERSRALGFRLFEVDISLDSQGRARCHHGPEDPAPFEPATSCTFERLLESAVRDKTWLVLDFKSDFDRTAGFVLDQAIRAHAADRLIFQLYEPANLAWFATRAAASPLPVPIVTAYRAARSANHIAASAARLHIRVLTVPTDKLVSLRPIDANIMLFTHPVHDCLQLRNAMQAAPVRGLFMASSLDPARCV